LGAAAGTVSAILAARRCPASRRVHGALAASDIERGTALSRNDINCEASHLLPIGQLCDDSDTGRLLVARISILDGLRCWPG
jgi:hypothetical protein